MRSPTLTWSSTTTTNAIATTISYAATNKLHTLIVAVYLCLRHFFAADHHSSPSYKVHTVRELPIPRAMESSAKPMSIVIVLVKSAMTCEADEGTDLREYCT
ncbi:uncharacterized protein LOC128864961 [Anastrepha ludens]|uniref:uncharacterized protein LOC128864961 n=1 Tax=Anastrepha ludens TaxID=28586 RepID=UPI0023B0E999|nr:uncharacterized protein LOC128864961 [Anastrepha ludens]